MKRVNSRRRLLHEAGAEGAPLLTPIEGGLAWRPCSRCWRTTPACGCSTPWCGPTNCADRPRRSVGMKPQAVRNSFNAFPTWASSPPRRDGNNIYYRLVDLCVAAPCWTRGCASWKRSVTAAGGGADPAVTEEKTETGWLSARFDGAISTAKSLTPP